jgi:RNA polymerase sigma-70 factor (family 1)
MSSLLPDFESIYKAYYRLLRSVSANIIRDADAAHDVVQEMFVKLYPKKDELGHVLNMKAYLCRAVVNASVAYLQKNSSKTQLTELSVATTENSDSTMMGKELQAHLEKAMESLPAKCKAIFVLSRFEEMKNSEIAETLGISVKTVENQMTIALRKMREKLKPYYGVDIAALALSAGLTLLFVF